MAQGEGTSKAVSGNDENNGTSYIYGSNLALGGTPVKDSYAQANGPGIKATLTGSGYKQGDAVMMGDAGHKIGRNGVVDQTINNAVTQAYPSASSGTTAWGHPHWGDGYQVTTMTWGADHEMTGKGEGNYFKPFAVTGFDYDSLET